MKSLEEFKGQLDKVEKREAIILAFKATWSTKSVDELFGRIQAFWQQLVLGVFVTLRDVYTQVTPRWLRPAE